MKFESFRDYYPYYLGEHANPRCRQLHFAGTSIVIGLALAAGFTGNPWLLLGTPVAGYGFAWVGHFGFEKNRPAAFKNPIWSLMGDFKMFFELATGKLSFTKQLRVVR